LKSNPAVRVPFCCFALLLVLATHSALGQTAGAYGETGLVADRPGADHISTTLLNPWGIAFLPAGNFFIAENASGRVDSYDADGNFVAGVMIPAPPGSAAPFSGPTGIVAIPEADFLPSLGSSGFQFLVAADSGTIWGFTTANGVPEAATKFADNSGAARYTGLAVLRPDCCGAFLAAANFRQGTVDTFTRLGDPLSLSPLVTNPFVDPNLPPGFSPFNIQVIGNQVFVTYAQRETGILSVPTDGAGLVNIFDLMGNFIRRFVSPGDAVSAPWGITQASANFGPFSNDIIIANATGDGSINAFDPTSGNFLGQLKDGTGNALFFVGMRGLAFRADGVGDPNALYNVDGAAQGATPAGTFGTITVGNAAFLGLTFADNTLRAAVVPNDPVTVTATLGAASGTPTGNVVFVDTCCTLTPPLTQTTLGTANVVNGVASIVATFAAGDHQISARYSGDTSFVPSSRSSLLAVLFETQTTVTAPSSATVGTPVLLSANVSSTPPVQPSSLTGQVTFSDGNITLGTIPLVGGAAQSSINSLAPGEHNIVAAFSGSGFFQGGQSAPVTINVGNPVPGITSLVPFSATQNSGAFTLTVHGSGFVNGAVVTFNGSARATSFVSDTQVRASITASDLASSGTATVAVSNPVPGGGNSGMAMFAIDTATATSVTLDTLALSVVAGQSVTVRAHPTGFTGTVTLMCLNAPAGVTCAFDHASNSVTIQTSTTTPKSSSAITLVFNAQALARNLSAPAALAMSLGVLGLPLGTVVIEARRPRKLKTVFWVVPMSLLLLLVVGCGGYGGSGGTQPNLTPQIQTGQASASLTLTVQ